MNKLKHWISNGKTSHHILAIMAVYVMLIAIRGYFYGFKGFLFWDTATYFWSEKTIIKGELDFFRTPIYPLFCHLFGDSYTLIPIAQLIMYAATFPLLYASVEFCTKGNKTISFIATCLYAFNIAVVNWAFTPMTELPAICFVTIFIYLVTKLFDTECLHRSAYSIITPLFVFVMIMLRPFFLCFVPILAVIALYLYFCDHKQLCAKLCFSIAITLSLIYGYCYKIEQKYGVFTLSYVSQLNQYCVLADLNLIHDDSITDVWTRENAPIYIALSDSVLKKNIVKVAKNRVWTFINNTDDICPMPIDKWQKRVPGIFSFPLLYSYLLITAFSAMIIRKLRRKHEWLLDAVILCIPLLFIITTTWNAPIQHGRLMTPMFPALIMMLAIIAYHIKVNIKIERIK